MKDAEKREEFFARELETLKTMELDSLIKLSANAINVGNAGRLLVRNICMVFDRYIDTLDSKGQFSQSV